MAESVKSRIMSWSSCGSDAMRLSSVAIVEVVLMVLSMTVRLIWKKRYCVMRIGEGFDVAHSSENRYGPLGHVTPKS